MEKIGKITVVIKEIYKLGPGEMTWIDCGDRPPHWYIGCPNPDCGTDPKLHGIGNLAGHKVIDDDSGLTVSPSILCGCRAHYFVEKSKIRWV